MDSEKFGKFIKELRLKNHMTQQELAQKLNLTDKAISKWERGLGFPDITLLNSLAEIFHVDVSEILNGEYGKKEKIDVEKIVQETIEKIENKKEEKRLKRNKIKKIIGIISIFVCFVFFVIQCGYFFVLRNHEFEYVIDSLLYIFNFIITITACVSFLCLLKKNTIRNIIVCIVCTILFGINLIFMLTHVFHNRSIVTFSDNFSNELVLKQNLENGKMTIYRNIKLFIFGKPREEFPYPAIGDVKTQWLTKDICNVTYVDVNGILRDYVATYGDRGNGISYYYVTNTLLGDWADFNKNENVTKLSVDDEKIIVTKNGTTDTFELSDCKQFGTIAIVLYKNEIPKYVIALNENCTLDEKTDIIKKGGTITIVDISMEKTPPEELTCTTYKAEDLEDYHLVSLAENDYIIKNGILYISYNGKDIIKVPGDFSGVESLYTDDNYQISHDKTVFFTKEDNKMYLVYSDDQGENWEKVMIDTAHIQSIQFLNSDVGYIFEFLDVAMGTAFGKILKTTDGGKTWNTVSYGIGEEGNQVFKTSSKLYFVTGEIGFLTMPHTAGEYSDLYMTKDGGNQFSQVILEENDIYDYYFLPEIKDGKLILEISQGSDGDYHGGDSKIYLSDDNGNSWYIQQ